MISAMPTNLYGPGDNFDLSTSHAVPALLREAHEAATTGADSLVIWGPGTPKRKCLHVEGCADALVFALQSHSEEAHISVRAGAEL